MNDQQVQEISDRLITALEGLAPHDQGWWAAACLTLVSVALLITTLKRQRDRYILDEWWRRAQWAMNATTSANDKLFSYGIAVLSVLAKSSHASPREKAVFDAVWKASSTRMQDKEIHRVMQRLRLAGPHLVNGRSERDWVGASEDVNASEREGAEMSLSTMRREILAARLKVVLDEQLDRQTSPAVQGLAMMMLSPHRR